MVRRSIGVAKGFPWNVLSGAPKYDGLVVPPLATEVTKARLRQYQSMISSGINSEHLVANGMMHLAQRWCGTRQPVNMLNTDDIDYLLPVDDSAPQAVHLVYELRCLGYALAVGWTNRPLALGDMTILDTYISATGDVKRTADQVASLQRWRRRENVMWASELLRADGRTLRARFGKHLRQKVGNLEDDSMRLTIAFGTGLKEPAMAPRVGFMTRAAWDRVREGELIWHDDTVCEVVFISRDEVRLRSYVNVATGISTRDKRLEFCAGEEGSISVDAQLFLVDDVVVREDGRLLITADEIRVVR